MLDTPAPPLSSVKGTAGSSVGASTRRTGPILEDSETDAGTNGVSAKLNAAQESNAELVAKLPSDFPIQKWDSMSTKAQLQAMKFSGLTENEQWALLNPSAPLSVLAQAAAQQKTHIVARAEAKVLPAPELSTETPKTTPLQPKGPAGEFGEEPQVKSIQPGKTPSEPSVTTKTVLAYPAIAHFASVGNLESKQIGVLARAQIKLVLLNKNGTPTQQEVDDVLADACTKLLNDKNAPTNKDKIGKNGYQLTQTQLIIYSLGFVPMEMHSKKS